MHERLVPLILTADREIRQAADSGEHPLAALKAVIDCTGEALGLGMYGKAEQHEWYVKLSSVRGGVERAVEVYPIDRERAAVILRQELGRLARLVRIAKEAREREEAFA